MYWFSTLLLLVPIIAGVICIAIAASWPHRAPTIGESAIVVGFVVLTLIGPIYILLKDGIREGHPLDD